MGKFSKMSRFTVLESQNRLSTSYIIARARSRSPIWRGKFNCSSHLFLTFSPISHAVRRSLRFLC